MRQKRSPLELRRFLFRSKAPYQDLYPQKSEKPKSWHEVDYSHSIEQLRLDPTNQILRRAALRAASTFVEFHCEHIWSSAIEQKEIWVFTAAQQLVMSRTKFLIKDDGSIQEIPNHFPLKARIKFVYKAMISALRPGFSLKVPVEFWQELGVFFSARNRIIHPTRTSDSHISDTENWTILRLPGIFTQLSWQIVCASAIAHELEYAARSDEKKLEEVFMKLEEFKKEIFLHLEVDYGYYRSIAANRKNP